MRLPSPFPHARRSSAYSSSVFGRSRGRSGVGGALKMRLIIALALVLFAVALAVAYLDAQWHLESNLAVATLVNRVFRLP